jgi:hypothetical protein
MNLSTEPLDATANSKGCLRQRYLPMQAVAMEAADDTIPPIRTAIVLTPAPLEMSVPSELTLADRAVSLSFTFDDAVFASPAIWLAACLAAAAFSWALLSVEVTVAASARICNWSSVQAVSVAPALAVDVGAAEAVGLGAALDADDPHPANRPTSRAAHATPCGALRRLITEA